MDTGGYVAVPVPAAQPDKQQSKQLESVVAQLVWSARRDNWAGVVESRHLQYVSVNLAILAGRLSRVVTRSFFQALLSIMQRAVKHVKDIAPSSLRIHVIHNGAVAARILAQLNEQQTLLPSTVANPTPLPGQDVTDELLVTCAIEGVTTMSEREWLTRTNNDTHRVVLSFYNALWHVVSLLVGASQETRTQCVRFTLRTLTNEALQRDVRRDMVMTTSFLRHMGALLSSLARGSIGNWVEVVLKLLDGFMRLRIHSSKVRDIVERAPALQWNPPGQPVRLGSLDLFNLTSSLVIITECNSLHLHVASQFKFLLATPCPGAPSFLSSILGTAAQRDKLFRTAVVKALQDVGNTSPSANFLFTGMLSAATAQRTLLDKPAQAALLETTRKFCCQMEVDLGEVQLATALDVRLKQLCHVLAMANMLPPTWVRSLTDVEREGVSRRLRAEYLNLVLADELLFADTARTKVNDAFIRSAHLRNHHKVMSPHTAGLQALLQELKLSRDKEFIRSIHQHTKAVDDLLCTWFMRSRADQEKLEDFKRLGSFLEKSFGDVLAVIVQAAPEADRHLDEVAALDTDFKVMCVETLEGYFPAFKYSFLPPMPPPLNAVQRRDDKMVQRHRARVMAAVKLRRQYQQMNSSLIVLLRMLEKDAPGGRPYTQHLIEGVDAADRKVVEAKHLHSLWALTFRLHCLRLAITQEQAKDFAHLIPRLLAFVSGYPSLVLLASHALIVKLAKEPSLEAAKGFCLYINACIPTRAAQDGSLYVDPKLFPTTVLLKEFTKHVRSLCQALEEWDVLDDAGSGAPTGVGLVMYTVEALRHCILFFIANEASFSHKARQEASTKKRLYINCLVNLLQCSTTDVLTKVCASLEVVLSSLTSVNEVSFWLGYTSKRIKQQAHNPSTKQQVVAWFLTLQSILTPEKLTGMQAKL